MNQLAVTRYPCKFHPEYSIEYLCVAKSCYYSSILYNSYITEQDQQECQSRLSCQKCIEMYHSTHCGVNCYLSISKSSFQMPDNFDPICQRVVDITDYNRNQIDNIDALFEELKTQFLKKLDSEKKNIIKDFTLLNNDILDFNHKLSKKWNFSSLFYNWIAEVNHDEVQNFKKFSQILEDRIQKCNELTERISQQFKTSSSSFQIFTNIEQQIQEINKKISIMFQDFDLQKKSELCKSQDFKFITLNKNIDISAGQEGLQIIRNSQQCYFECFTPEDLIPNKTYQVLFSFDKVPSNSITIGLVNSESLNNSRLEKKVSQSLVYSYNKNMGNIIKGQPLYRILQANQVYKVVVNLQNNIFYISDEEEQNIISIDKNFNLLKGDSILNQDESITNSNDNKYFTQMKWRIFISLNEPIMNIKILKTIKY